MVISDISLTTFPIDKDQWIEYSDDLHKIYSQYLSDKPFDEKCAQKGQLSDIKEADFVDAFQTADKQLLELKAMDETVFNNNPRAKLFDEKLYQANLQAIHNEFVTKQLILKKCLSKRDVVDMRNNVTTNVPSSDVNDCQNSVSRFSECNSSYKYRTISGKCNNLLNTEWGSALSCQRRLLPPDYKDGISEIRVSSDGTPLPNTRELSLRLFREKPFIINHNLLFVSWGQLVVHDTFSRVMYLGDTINCCSGENSKVHPECLQIDHFKADQESIKCNQSNIQLSRTVACNRCKLGSRTQINRATSFLDLSNIYGTDEQTSQSLRTFQKGELIVEKAQDDSYVLPKDESDVDKYELLKCRTPNVKPELTCFKNGDGIRGNQNPPIMAMNLVMIRRHNQHCRGLARVNPHWDDEKLYQEARRLLIAEYQNIVYGEYIGEIVGTEIMDKFELSLKKNGFTEYKSGKNPTAIISTGGAALRLGHFAVNSKFIAFTDKNENSIKIDLREKYFEMSDIWEGKAKWIIKGLRKIASNLSPHLDDELQNYLFSGYDHPVLKDLGAINIQRGRDYGLPGFIYYIEYFTGTVIKSWDDLKPFIANDKLDALKSVYRDYKDIDLFVGGSYENGFTTFRYLMATQWHNSKYGDRFYFEHKGQAGSYNEDQLNNIRDSVSLANLLCKTMDFESIASKPFLIDSESNPQVMCNTFNEINYILFSECTDFLMNDIEKEDN